MVLSNRLTLSTTSPLLPLDDFILRQVLALWGQGSLQQLQTYLWSPETLVEKKILLLYLPLQRSGTEFNFSGVLLI